MKQSDPITHLLSFGTEPSDPIREPELNADGAFTLEAGEEVVHSGRHKVDISVWNKTAGVLGSKQRWEIAVKMEKKADVHFTNQRLLFAWPKWKSDRATGSLFERRVMAPLLERDEGKMLLGGHLRHPWVTSVFVAKPKGTFSPRSAIRLDVQAYSEQYSVSVRGFEPTAAQALGQAFAAVVSERRLADCTDLDDDARAALEVVAAREATPEELDWAYRYRIPGGLKIGNVFSPSGRKG